MNKFKGYIGFVSQVEDPPGIFKEEVIERKATGDILKNTQRFSIGDTTNGDIKITNSFSIIGDSYAWKHVADIRYLVWQGNNWTIDSIDMEYPRLIVTLGGLYNNGPQTNSADDPDEY